MTKTFAALLALTATLALSASAFASVENTVAFDAPEVAAPPPLDASLSAPVWKQALEATGFWNYTTREPAKLATTAYFLYDDKNLYVGFFAVQRGVPITATQSVNDVGYGLDDAVTFAVDTSDNNSRIYSFSVTPAGVRYETSSESARYRPPWKAVAQRTAQGYRVMMVIPLSDLRTQSTAVQTWRIDFTRHVAATGDLFTWAYVPGSEAYCNNNQYGALVYCDATKWPSLRGLRVGIRTASRPKPNAEIYGLSSSGSDRDQFEATPGSITTHAPRTVGLDFTYPFTPTISLVGTLAPDFSNVEQDQTTIAPQEFTRAYQEYRPFFAQGFGYIDALPHFNVNGTGSTIFYTPSIGVFDSGFKVEGTTGRNSLGALTVNGPGFDDQAFGFSNSRPDGSFSVSTEGVLAHHLGISDQTLGAGVVYQNLHSGFEPVALYEQERGTLVNDPGQANRMVGGAILQHGGLLVGGIFQDIGPEFSPVDGYTAVNDIRGPQLLVNFQGTPRRKGVVKSYTFGGVADRFLDESGAVHQADIGVGAGVTSQNLLSVNVGGGASELRAYEEPYPAYLGGKTMPFNQSNIALGYKDGTPSPTDFSYSYGPFSVFCPGSAPQPELCNGVTGVPFAAAFVQQLDLSATRPLGRRYGLTMEYGGTIEHGDPGPLDSQWLRRLSLTRSFGSDAVLAIGLRSINGTGGFAPPGTNLAISFQEHFRDQDQLYVEYGTPAAASTLHRFIVKYVFHAGGGTGT